jgi:DNA-binding NarL/FixJ family response regulator
MTRGSEPAGGPVIVALVPDLMDRSKVSAAAPGRVRFVNRAADLAATASDAAGPAGLAVVDLGRPGALDAVRAVAALAPRPTVLAFGSHVDRDLLAAARQAGADRVLARSAFFGDLVAHLR